MLDKKAEKILRFIISKYDGNLDKDIVIYPDEVKLHYSELDSMCNYMREIGLLQMYCYSGFGNEPAYAILSHCGLHYFENNYKKLLQFWLPIVTSNIIALAALIVSILSYLK